MLLGGKRERERESGFFQWSETAVSGIICTKTMHMQTENDPEVMHDDIMVYTKFIIGLRLDFFLMHKIYMPTLNDLLPT